MPYDVQLVLQRDYQVIDRATGAIVAHRSTQERAERKARQLEETERTLRASREENERAVLHD
jgi:hypothetical protein